MDSKHKKYDSESEDDINSDILTGDVGFSTDTEDSMSEVAAGRRPPKEKPQEVVGYPEEHENCTDTTLDVYSTMKSMLDYGDERMDELVKVLKKIQVNAKMPQTTRVIKAAIKDAMFAVENIRRVGVVRAMQVNRLKHYLEKEVNAGKKDSLTEENRCAAPMGSATPKDSGEPKETGAEREEAGVFAKPLPPSTPRLPRKRIVGASPVVTPSPSPLPSPLPSPVPKRKATDMEGPETPKTKRKAIITSIEVIKTSTATQTEEPAGAEKEDKGKKPAYGKPPLKKRSGTLEEEGKEEIPAETWATITRGRKKKMSVAPTDVALAREPKKIGDGSAAGSQPKEKKIKKKITPRKPRERPAAVEVKIKEGTDYAATLIKIKKEVRLEDVTVTSIRKTRAGNLLIETGKSQEQARNTRANIAKALGDTAEVRQLEPRLDIEIRDIDEVTTRVEVIEALEREIPDIEDSMQFRALKTGFGGMRAAILTLPTSMAEELLKRGRIKIGWVSCRIKALPRLTRCYKCHRLGHLAANCAEKSGPATCRGCHAAGHQIKECTATPICLVCKERGGKGSYEHVTASRRCPVYQKIARSQSSV